MKCSTSNLQLENIITRIKNKDIDLQPEFQRGEVWSVSKQKKLIDSILRNWTIPPIHVVPRQDGVDEVLDGQQRLVAIRDFVNNKFKIDGNILPKNEFIVALDGLTYDDLPAEVRRMFNRYDISFVTLSDFQPSEPAELFDRLNQPMKLTSAEQRNAYMGKTRNQIKGLVNDFESCGAKLETLGFSNSRLAYDEIISKLCYAIDIKTLRKKIVSGDIASKYRSDDVFSQEAIDLCHDTLNSFMRIINSNNTNYTFSFNKATIFSWLVFVKQNPLESDEMILQTMLSFEIIRDYLKGKHFNSNVQSYIDWYEINKKEYAFLDALINVYNQRASIGSTDVLSIIYRDIILHIFHLIVNKYNLPETPILDVFSINAENSSVISAIEQLYEIYQWGNMF